MPFFPLALAQAAPPAEPAAADEVDLTPGTVEEGVDRLTELWQTLVDALPTAGIGLLVLVGFVIVAAVVKWVVQRWSGRDWRHRSLAIALGRLAYGVIIVVGLLIACVIVFPNFTPTGLLTSLGVGSLVLGLAFKDVLQNYLAGILLLFAEPFRAGDQIQFKEYEGTVEDVQARATFIRTYDGRRVVIPNAEMFTNSITVNTAFDKRRVEYDFGIGYGDDIERAKRLILEGIRETDTAMDDPGPEVLTYELAASWVTLRARWWIKPPVVRETFDARDQVLSTVKAKLTAAGIDLPFPTSQVLFHDQTESTDGDRRRQREGWPAGRDSDPPEPRRIADAVEALAAKRMPEGDGRRG